MGHGKAPYPTRFPLLNEISAAAFCTAFEAVKHTPKVLSILCQVQPKKLIQTNQSKHQNKQTLSTTSDRELLLVP